MSHHQELKSNDARKYQFLALLTHEMVRHLTLLIDDLLNVSRLAQDKIELRGSEVILDDMCARAITPARSQVEEKQHELTVSLPKRPVNFSADATCVEQILSNLLTNVANYSEPGKSIRLSTEIVGEEIVFRVRDQGFGITEEMLPKSFGLLRRSTRQSIVPATAWASGSR